MLIKKTTEEKEILFRMNQLRGILAFVVLFSHIWGYTGLVFLVPFNKIVTIAVGFFFFLSGYGMIQSFKEKEHYLKNIFKVKIPFLLWMALLAYIFGAILEKILLSNGVMTNTFLPFGIKQFFISTNWYVYELIGFYLVFSLSMRFIKEKYQLSLIVIISIAAFIALYYSGVVEAYYNSIIGFWFGMFCGRHGCVQLMERHKKGYLFGGCILILSFWGMFVFDHSSIIFAIVRNFAAVGAIIIALYIVKCVNLNNVIMKYLSKISPEIYFYHMPIALLCSQVLKNNTVYAIVVIVASVSVAALVNPLNRKMQILIKGA